MQAVAFRAENQSAVHFVIKLIVKFVAALIQPNGPDILGF